METRREALKIIGAVGATCSFPFSANELYGQHVHQPEPKTQDEEKAQTPFEPQYFTQDQFQVISRLADLIIPPTDTPGAVAAGVPRYIDLVVNRDRKLQIIFHKGLRRLDGISKSKFHGSDFLQLAPAEQVEVLTLFSKAAQTKPTKKNNKQPLEGLFFEAIKNLTADGYYTSRVGLLEELGYNGNMALASFPELTIPEH